MGFSFDTWGGSWGTSWGGSWGSADSAPQSSFRGVWVDYGRKERRRLRGLEQIIERLEAKKVKVEAKIEAVVEPLPEIAVPDLSAAIAQEQAILARINSQLAAKRAEFRRLDAIRIMVEMDEEEAELLLLH